MNSKQNNNTQKKKIKMKKTLDTMTTHTILGKMIILEDTRLYWIMLYN